MKTITLIQPWATLIALGEKKFETRGWETKHRGPLAIHAGKKIDKEAFNQPAIYQALLKYGIEKPSDLPTSAILATVDLIECHKVATDYDAMYDEEKAGLHTGKVITGDEWWFGDYSEGRYAWELANVKKLAEPIAEKGQLRLWNCDKI